MVDEKLHMMYRVLKLIMMVHFEEHRFEDGTEIELFKAMNELDQMMSPVVVTPVMVRYLRDCTGEGTMACKAAIIKARGDLHLAKEYLR